MLGQYILQQLNQLRCHQVYCDLELVSSDKVVFSLHQVVFTALNKRHFNLAIENAEAGMYDVVSKKKMILSCLDSAELKLLIDFMYGITVTEEDSYGRLVSALKKLHMADLLQNSDCSNPRQSLSSLPTQSGSCQTDGSTTGVNSYTVQNQHVQPNVSPRAVVEKSGSLNCGHNKILEVDQIKVEDTDQRPVTVGESSAANLHLEANTVEKVASDQIYDRQNNGQNEADTGHSVGISVIHRQNTENEVNLSNFLLQMSKRDQLKSKFESLVCGNGSSPHSVQKEGTYCHQKGTTLDPVNCDGKGYQNQRMNIDIKQEPVENENMFTYAAGVGIGLDESGKEPTRDESMGLEATRTYDSEPSLYNTDTERNVREEPLLDPYEETDQGKSFTTPTVNISLPAKHVEVSKTESHTNHKSNDSGEVCYQNDSVSSRAEKHSVKGTENSMQSISSPKLFAINIQRQNLDMWRKPHQRRRSADASVNDRNAPSQSAMENGTKNDKRLLCDSGRDEQKLSSSKPVVSNLNSIKETKTVGENPQNELRGVTTHVPVSEILTIASADNITTDAPTAQSVCTKLTGSLQCKWVHVEEQSLKQDKRSNVKNAGAQNIPDKKKIMPKPSSTSVANTSENCWMPIILKLSPSMASVGTSAVTNASVSLSVLNQTSSSPALNSVPVVTRTTAVPDVSNGRMCSAKITKLSSGSSQTCMNTEESVEYNGCPEKVRKTPTVSSQSNLAAVGTNEKRLSVKLVDIFGHNSSCNTASSVYFNGKQVSPAKNLADPSSGQNKTPSLSIIGRSAVNSSASVNNGPSDLLTITKGSPRGNKVLDESRNRNTSKTLKDILTEDCSSQRRKKFKTGAKSISGNFLVKRSEEMKVNSGHVENTGCKKKDESMDIGDGKASDRVCDNKHCEQWRFSEPQTIGNNTLAEGDAVTISSESSGDEVPLVGLTEHGKAKKFKTSSEIQNESFASPNEKRQRSISERTPELSRLLSTKRSPVTFQLKPLDFGMDSQIKKNDINSEQDHSSNVPQKNSRRGRKRICSMPKIQLLAGTHKRQKVVVKKTMSLNRKAKKRQLKSTGGIKTEHIDGKKIVASTEPFICLNTIPVLPNGQVNSNTSCMSTLSQSSSFLSCSKESSGVSVTVSPVLLSSDSSQCTMISSFSKDNKGDSSKKEIGKCPLEKSGLQPDQPLQTLEPVQFGNFRKILPKPRTRPLMFLTFPEQNKTASNNAKDAKGSGGPTK